MSPTEILDQYETLKRNLRRADPYLSPDVLFEPHDSDACRKEEQEKAQIVTILQQLHRIAQQWNIDPAPLLHALAEKDLDPGHWISYLHNDAELKRLIVLLRIRASIDQDRHDVADAAPPPLDPEYEAWRKHKQELQELFKGWELVSITHTHYPNGEHEGPTNGHLSHASNGADVALSEAARFILRKLAQSGILLKGPDAYAGLEPSKGKAAVRELEEKHLAHRPEGQKKGYAATAAGREWINRHPQ